MPGHEECDAMRFQRTQANECLEGHHYFSMQSGSFHEQMNQEIPVKVWKWGRVDEEAT